MTANRCPAASSPNRSPAPSSSGGVATAEAALAPRRHLLPPNATIYLKPLDLFAPAEVGVESGTQIAGGLFHYRCLELVWRERGGSSGSMCFAPQALREWAAGEDLPFRARIDTLLTCIAAPRVPLAGLRFDRPQLMGVINVTPDSFSDGGRFWDAATAIEHGQALHRAGADLLDVGGESTRPGSEPINVDEELSRVLPVLAGLKEVPIPISIDTRRAAVMSAALEAGAALINDISALAADPDSLAIAAACEAPIVLMHCLGDPRTMQDSPTYENVLLDIFDYLEARIAACVEAGIDRDRLIVDPGIGFGKTVDHNLDLLRGLALFHGLGCPILIGVSRKSFIGRLDRGRPPDQRLPGSLAAGLWALGQGAQMLRVHEVNETVQAARVWSSLQFPGTRL